MLTLAFRSNSFGHITGPLALAVVALLTATASPASAQFFESRWTNPSSGDGYAVENWDQVDTEFGFVLDDVFVNNGGTAEFSFSSPLRDDVDQDDEFTNLVIGSRTRDEDPESVSGTMLLDDLDLIVASDALIGTDMRPGTARGFLTLRAGANGNGDLYIERDLTIGGETGVSREISPGTRGEVIIDGSLRPTEFSPANRGIRVGQGLLDVGGDIEDSPFISLNGTALDGAVARVGGRIETGGTFAFQKQLWVGNRNGFGELSVGEGVFGLDSIEVGARGGNGELEVLSGGIGASGSSSTGPRISVGTRFSRGGTPTVGTARIVGDVDAESLLVGVGSNATGDVTVIGDLRVGLPSAPSFSGLIGVGINEIGETARGTLRVEGDVEGLIRVGVKEFSFPADQRESVNAIGRIEISGDATVSELAVGWAGYRLPGEVDGELLVGGDLVLSGDRNRIGASDGLEPFPPEPMTGEPVVRGRVEVGGVTRFLPRPPNSQGGPILEIGAGSSRSSAPGGNGYLSTEAIERVDRIFVGSGDQGSRGELLVRSGGVSGIEMEPSPSPFPVFGIRGIEAGSYAGPNMPGSIGIVDITGDITDMDILVVTNDESSITLRDGAASLARLLVGTARQIPGGTLFGGASRMELDGYLIETDSVSVGEAATLALRIGGETRGAGFSAIDATANVILDGTLEVLVESFLSAGIYDLITAQTIGGFTDLEQMISLVGLSEGQASFAIVPTSTIEGLAGFALRMTVVPEPSTALLLGLGLAALARGRGRRGGDA